MLIFAIMSFFIALFFFILAFTLIIKYAEEQAEQEAIDYRNKILEERRPNDPRNAPLQYIPKG